MISFVQNKTGSNEKTQKDKEHVHQVLTFFKFSTKISNARIKFMHISLQIHTMMSKFTSNIAIKGSLHAYAIRAQIHAAPQASLQYSLIYYLNATHFRHLSKIYFQFLQKFLRNDAYPRFCQFFYSSHFRICYQIVVLYYPWIRKHGFFLQGTIKVEGMVAFVLTRQFVSVCNDLQVVVTLNQPSKYIPFMIAINNFMFLTSNLRSFYQIITSFLRLIHFYTIIDHKREPNYMY